MKKVTFKLTIPQHKKFKAKAKKQGKTLSDVLREAVKDFVN